MDTYIVKMIDGDMISIEAADFRLDHDKNYLIFETESDNGAYFNTNNIVGFWNADLVQGIFSKPGVKPDLKRCCSCCGEQVTIEDDYKSPKDKGLNYCTCCDAELEVETSESEIHMETL